MDEICELQLKNLGLIRGLTWRNLMQFELILSRNHMIVIPAIEVPLQL